MRIEYLPVRCALAKSRNQQYSQFCDQLLSHFKAVFVAACSLKNKFHFEIQHKYLETLLSARHARQLEVQLYFRPK